MIDAESTDQKAGHCLCGSIAFTVSGNPLWVAHCHCQSCRRNTGSVAATFIGYHPSQVIFKQDTRQFYASSPDVQRGFCPCCGTPVSYESSRWPEEIHLYLSLMESPEDFQPTSHVHTAEKIPWLTLDPDLPKHLQTSAEPPGSP